MVDLGHTTIQEIYALNEVLKTTFNGGVDHEMDKLKQLCIDKLTELVNKVV